MHYPENPLDPKNAITIDKQGHKCLQSLLISIPTCVGTKYFSVIHAPAKRIFGLNTPPRRILICFVCNFMNYVD